MGASTLRHYFPTQRALLDAVLTDVYTEAFPDQRIRDRSVPARERLFECLWHLLTAVGTEEAARKVWTDLVETFVGPEATDASREGYFVLERHAEQRVASWLAVLRTEGALPPGDDDLRVHFLLTMVDGLSLGRALPSSESRREREVATLRAAVEWVLTPLATAPSTPPGRPA